MLDIPSRCLQSYVVSLRVIGVGVQDSLTVSRPVLSLLSRRRCCLRLVGAAAADARGESAVRKHCGKPMNYRRGWKNTSSRSASAMAILVPEGCLLWRGSRKAGWVDVTVLCACACGARPHLPSPRGSLSHVHGRTQGTNNDPSPPSCASDKLTMQPRSQRAQTIIRFLWRSGGRGGYQYWFPLVSILRLGPAPGHHAPADADGWRSTARRGSQAPNRHSTVMATEGS